MRPQLALMPVALLLFLLALVAGASKLLTIQGAIYQPFLPVFLPRHGQLMVFGFLAILIIVERYIGALTFPLHPVVHTMPFLVAIGAVLQLLGWMAGLLPLKVAGAVLLAAGMVIYIYMLMSVGRRSAQPLPFQYMSLAGIVLLTSAILGVFRSPEANLPFTLLLLGFPVITILGERVELTRFTAPRFAPRARYGLYLVAAAFALVLLQMLFLPGSRVLIAVWTLLLLALTLPLAQAEIPLMGRGQTRLHQYMGPHLAMAYGWLLLGMAFLLGVAVSGISAPLGDAATHSLAVGFVGSMILAHAPVVAPALFGWATDETKLSLLPLRLLTGANLLRVAADLGTEVGRPMPLIAVLSVLFLLASLIAFATMMVRTLISGQTALSRA